MGPREICPLLCVYEVSVCIHQRVVKGRIGGVDVGHWLSELIKVTITNKVKSSSLCFSFPSLIISFGSPFKLLKCPVFLLCEINGHCRGGSALGLFKLLSCRRRQFKKSAKKTALVPAEFLTLEVYFTLWRSWTHLRSVTKVPFALPWRPFDVYVLSLDFLSDRE
jgi:hypothetical protein